MALQRNERYPGRFSNPNSAHPQGAFKNRTSPTSQDGSYLESDWANDWDGFFARILTIAGVTPNGNVDTGLSSQYFDALILSVKNNLGNVAQRTVGETSSTQIPDMSFFSSLSGDSGYIRIPGGKLLVYGTGLMTGGTATVTLPITFKNTSYRVVASDRGNGCLSLGVNNATPGTITIYRPGKAYNVSGVLVDVTGSSSFSYIAMGDAA